MKLRDADINAVLAFWSSLLAKANQNKSRYPLIATFLVTLKEALSTIDVDRSVTLKVCVGALRFTPDKSLFASIFNQARIKAGLSMSDFVYGASMLVEANNKIIVKDGFYKPSYRFVPAAQSLTPEDFLKYHENNQSKEDVAIVEKVPEILFEPKVKEAITNKRQVLSADHAWNFKGSKYMKFDTPHYFFSSKPTVVDSHSGSPTFEGDESSLNSSDLESLYDIETLAEINKALTM